jgi:hypothetical protein
MTRRHILRLQCRLRRSVDGLYHHYLESVLLELLTHDHAGEISRAIADLPAHRGANRVACTKPRERTTVQLKLHGDFGCARVREQLWRLQHLPSDLATAYH